MTSKKQVFLWITIILSMGLSSCSKVNFSGTQSPASQCSGPECAGNWSLGTWSQCSRACGGGDQTRTVQCVDGSGEILDKSLCAGEEPALYRSCQMQSCQIAQGTFSWITEDWGDCSKTCGIGEQTREVSCVNASGDYVEDTLCQDSIIGAKPDNQRTCNSHSCAGPPPVEKNLQTTVAPGSNKADILIVVDSSASMAVDNLKLAQRLEGFVNGLANSNIDWQMCITTTDMQAVQGRPVIWSGTGTHLMNQQTSNKNTVFTDTITAIGANGSADEQGIAAMTTLVSENGTTGCIRDDSAFSVIMISDENERSVGGNSAWSTVQYQPLQTINQPSNFVAVAHQELGAEKKIAVNSIIVIPGDILCEAEQDAQGSPSFFGTLYKQLSDMTGGYIGSICANDYSANLEIVKEKLQNSLAQIDLECTPVASPDVQLTPDFTTNVIQQGDKLTFDPVLPEGTNVNIDYQCATGTN